MFRGDRQGSVLSSVFCMVMEEIIRVTEDRVDYQKLWYMQMT
jgi:hypothetical protein